MATESTLNRARLTELTEQGKIDRAAEAAAAEERRLAAEEEAREARRVKIAEAIALRVPTVVKAVDTAVHDAAAGGDVTYKKILRVAHTKPFKDGSTYPDLPQAVVEEETEITQGIVEELVGTYTAAGLGATALHPRPHTEGLYDPKDGLVGSYVIATDYGVEISWDQAE